MKNSRNLTAPAAWLRVAIASVAILALGLGSVAPHDEATEQAGTFVRVEVAESAVHPGAPEHIEGAEVKVHPGCPACLLQLGSGTVLSHPPDAQPPLARGAELASLGERISSEDTFRPGPARAPPVLSSPSA